MKISFFKKTIAAALSVFVMGGTLPAVQFAAPVMTSFAEEEYTEVTEGVLTYHVYPDHAEVAKCDTTVEGEVDIPAEVNGLPVTAIGRYAFQYCSGIKSVTMSDSVMGIGIGAFEHCKGLESVKISYQVTAIKELTFRYCSSLESIEIPDSITIIYAQAFRGCSSLNNVIIPERVSEIGAFAFEDCISLDNITLPDSVTTMEYGVFKGCTSLKSIELPDSISYFSDYRIADCGFFQNCVSLRSVKLPSYIKYIPDYAFFGCTSLTEIQLPGGITNIGERAFYGSAITGINIPDTVKIIQWEAFKNCDAKFNSVIIPASVTDIGREAFGYSNSSKIDNYTIYGYSGSRAETYAQKNEIMFVALDGSDPIVTTTFPPSNSRITYGDVNNDSEVNLNDAVAILQYIALSAKYPIEGDALEAADVCDNGTSGINGNDALAIMMVDAKLLSADKLPVDSKTLAK